MTAIVLEYLLAFHLYNNFFSFTQKLSEGVTDKVSFEWFSVFCSIRFRFVDLTKTERIYARLSDIKHLVCNLMMN